MTRQEVFEKTQSVLVDLFELDPQSVVLTAHLMDDLDLDSIDAIDLAVATEREMGLDVSEEEMRSLQTVQDVVDLIHLRLGEK
ncbi:MAG: acyl carrier protein [Myxococcota bacterium]|nr:acyl carrier protein [Myxococcota bacterium]